MLYFITIDRVLSFINEVYKPTITKLYCRGGHLVALPKSQTTKRWLQTFSTAGIPRTRHKLAILGHRNGGETALSWGSN